MPTPGGNICKQLEVNLGRSTPLSDTARTYFYFTQVPTCSLKTFVKRQIKKTFLRLQTKSKPAKEIHQETFSVFFFLKTAQAIPTTCMWKATRVCKQCYCDSPKLTKCV